MPAMPAHERLQRPAVKVDRRFQGGGEQISDELTRSIPSGRCARVSSTTQAHSLPDVIPGLVPGIQLCTSAGATGELDPSGKRRDDLFPDGATATVPRPPDPNPIAEPRSHPMPAPPHRTPAASRRGAPC